ncbi:MAG: uncharacterized protein QOH90_1664 [Actinomycetota bacterium]|nr:uncharacterized protein [Actinomycetota bacterium]
MTNRLAQETSPYLLQHKDNPVDWWPWGDDALDEALRRDKPILLSIGYAACHWCHVMERESFEDETIAHLMNENFVCIKVDREERPDIDAVYMEAVQAMTGQGGWPMTMFLTPEGHPFYGGTYFPPVDRHGLPSFRTLLQGVAEGWSNQRDLIEKQGRVLTGQLGALSQVKPSEDSVTEDVLKVALEGLRSAADPLFGGFGGAPKFPQPMTVDLLLRLGAKGWDGALDIASGTLDAMARGGIFDQLRGGFHRYSVDREWVVPHFEKMLYDNAQLLRTYARSYQLTGSELHERVALATGAWLLAEMVDDSGGFWSTLDADSEGVEGKFYVWSLDEVREVAGADADAAIDAWGITDQGNFEGANILVHAEDPSDGDALERARAAMLQRRALRVRPATDSKVLTAWNGLAASALAEAGLALDKSEWVEAAERAMRFVLSTLRVDGRLMRSYRAGVVKHLGFAEDYAFAIEALLKLFEATGDRSWLVEARTLADQAIELFHDRDGGGFFTSGSDAPRLVARSKDLVDNAVPAANSVMAMELQRLALFTGNDRYLGHAEEILRILHPAASRSPLGFGHLLGAIDLYVSESREIVIVGPDSSERSAMEAEVHKRFLPGAVSIIAGTVDADAEREIPLLQGRASNGTATAYVCTNGTCRLPVTSAADLAAQLDA